MFYFMNYIYGGVSLLYKYTNKDGLEKKEYLSGENFNT